MVYPFAGSQDSKASVWVVGANGKNPHFITGKEKDPLHPTFLPMTQRVFVAMSNFTGNHSPSARPARLGWDVLSVSLQSGATPLGAASTQITHRSFYDLRSLDVVAEGVNPGGTKVLISTYGYRIGALLKNFPLGIRAETVLQPHVKGRMEGWGRRMGTHVSSMTTWT